MAAAARMMKCFGTWTSAISALPSQMEMSTYLRQYLDACQGANVAAEIAYYAAQVAYFDRGLVTKTYIRTNQSRIGNMGLPRAQV